jgi:type IV pilus assembly protein PilN
MIRINLLPVKQARKREYGQQQLLLFLILIVLEVAVLYLIYNAKKGELETIEQEVAQVSDETAAISRLESEIATLQAQLAESTALRGMFDDLTRNRIGPGGVLEELKYLMNPWQTVGDRDPDGEVHFDRQAEMIQREQWGWEPNDVDPERVWLDTLSVEPNGFSLRGRARAGEDVASFLLRLESPRRFSATAAGEDPRPIEQPVPFFVQPELTAYTAVDDDEFGQVMQFQITGGVRYHPLAPRSN